MAAAAWARTRDGAPFVPNGCRRMRTFWTYLRPYRGLAALALLLAGVAQVLTLVDPIIFGRLIDTYARNPGARPERGRSGPPIGDPGTTQGPRWH